MKDSQSMKLTKKPFCLQPAQEVSSMRVFSMIPLFNHDGKNVRNSHRLINLSSIRKGARRFLDMYYLYEVITFHLSSYLSAFYVVSIIFL